MADITRRQLFKGLLGLAVACVFGRSVETLEAINDDPVVLDATVFVQEWPYLTDTTNWNMYASVDNTKLWVETRKGSHVWINLLS